MWEIQTLIQLTSPADAAKPDTQREAKRLEKDLVLAAHISEAHNSAMDTINASRFLNLTATGTQKKFPKPSNRKLN